MCNLDTSIIEELKKMKQNHKPVVEILKFLTEALELNKDSRLIAISYFREAFSLTLGEAAQIGAWEFFDGGTWREEDMEKRIGILLR